MKDSDELAIIGECEQAAAVAGREVMVSVFLKLLVTALLAYCF